MWSQKDDEIVLRIGCYSYPRGMGRVSSALQGRFSKAECISRYECLKGISSTAASSSSVRVSPDPGSEDRRKKNNACKFFNYGRGTCREGNNCPFSHTKAHTSTRSDFKVTDEELKNSPSRKDNISESLETKLRAFGTGLIQEASKILRLSQADMATAQLIFQRFFCKRSFAAFDVKIVAATCARLAPKHKLEENLVIRAFYATESRRQKLQTPVLDSQSFSELIVELSKTERCVLQELGTVETAELPQEFLSKYLPTVGTSEVKREALALANQSFRTTLCVRFPSETVSCGVLYAAARRCNVQIDTKPPWWRSFGVSLSSLMEVEAVLAGLGSESADAPDSRRNSEKEGRAERKGIETDKALTGKSTDAVLAALGSESAYPKPRGDGDTQPTRRTSSSRRYSEKEARAEHRRRD